MEMSDQVLEFVRRREEADMRNLVLENYKWALDMVDRAVRSESFRNNISRFKMPVMVPTKKKCNHSTIRMIKCLCMSAIRAWLRKRKLRMFEKVM